MSHVGGRTGDRFHSPDDQAAEIATWAKARGHRVEMLAPELDAKGSDASRPIFRQAIEGVKVGTYAGVVVAYLSRAGRDLRLMLDLWDEVEAAGGAVYSARENIDASTPAGRLHRNLLASIAQHELEERREGFENARRYSVEQGIWQRRQRPRGYQRDESTRRLVPDARADEVRAAARDFLAGATVLSLSRRLAMTPGGIRAMLRNRVYLGELKVGRHVNPEAHEPLLDPQTFEAVQAKLASGVRPPRGSGIPALLAGLVRCTGCGHVMTRGRSSRTPVYTCPVYHSGERCPRPASIACGRLDAYVEPIAIVELSRLAARFSASDQVAGAQREAERAKAELSAYLAAVDAAGIGSADAAEGMRSRREAAEEAEQRLRAEMARAPILPRLAGGAEVWVDLDGHERNELLRGLLAAVVVRAVGSGNVVAVGKRARVLRYGADLSLPPRRGGKAAGLVPIVWDDIDGDDVLGVATGEDALEC